MTSRRQLPKREHVFIASLKYHGFNLKGSRKNLKFKKGYIFPSTKREDAQGIDLWVKMPKDYRIFPVQVTQRGVKMYKKYHESSGSNLCKFIAQSELRIQRKQRRCLNNRIAFALVRDYDGHLTNPTIAWGDIKSLRYGINHLRRCL